MTAHLIVDRLNRFGYTFIIVVVAVSLVLGLEATLLRERTLAALGNGPGGFFGLPGFFLMIPILLAMPSLIIGFEGLMGRDVRNRAYLLVVVGAMMVWLTFVIFTHGLDLCNYGIWTKSNRFDGTPLCEGTPPHLLGINSRFHLLMHAVPTALVVILYGWSLRRWLPQTFGTGTFTMGRVAPSLVDRINRIGLSLILATMAVGTVLGLVAAVFGAELSLLGEGLGGLYNFPILTLLATILLGLPALGVALIGMLYRKPRQMVYALAFIGPIVVFVVFLFIAHAFDPCENGWWRLSTLYNGVPMCQAFDRELNIHSRFHLLWHTAIAWLAVIPYWYALRRWLPQTFFDTVRKPELTNRSTSSETRHSLG